MRLQTKRLLTLLLLIFPSVVFAQTAQEVRVNGTVKDEHGAFLPRISVTEKGTSNIVLTNEEGAYSIQVKPAAILVFTGVGFDMQEVIINAEGTRCLMFLWLFLQSIKTKAG